MLFYKAFANIRALPTVSWVTARSVLMEQATLVALIALLVSLIALLVALLQLLQNSALTAEGWRQCNATNLGQWSVFSRRKWLWSELRCEVKFTTPTLRIIDTSDLYREYRPGGLSFATSAYVKSRTEEHFGRLIFDQGSKFDRPESNIARAASHILGFGTLPSNIEEGWADIRLIHAGTSFKDSFWHRQAALPQLKSFFLSCRRWTRGYHFRYRSRQVWYRSRDRNAVTWDTLLREIYKLQLDTMRSRSAIENGKLHVFRETDLQRSLPSHYGRDGRTAEKRLLREDETILTLDLHRQSWDFVPPDVVRPLARSTITTMVILARRLGMEWKTFDISTELFRAEGKGCTLSASRVRGLGIVFRFDSSGRPCEQQPLCTAAADMAYFGILPGDSRLGISDYTLVDDNRELNINTFVNVELGREAMELRDKLHFWGRVVPNDAPAILCPFMPLMNSSMPRVYTAMGTLSHLDIFAKLSIFRAIGINRSQRERLNMRLRTMLPKRSTPLQFQDPNFPGSKVDVSLERLFANHPRLRLRIGQRQDSNEVVEDQRHSTNIRLDLSQTEAACKFIENLREIHNATTDYFEHMKDDCKIDTSHSQTVPVAYTHVVKSHMALVHHCIMEWHKEQEMGRNQDEPKNHADGDKKHGKPKGPIKNHAYTDLKGGWETLLYFSDALPHNLHVFRNRLRSLSPDYSELSVKKVDELWWMLVARGVAWQLSVNIARTNSLTMVPSSIYGSELPVWIE